jgi:hypothetical protein
MTGQSAPSPSATVITFRDLMNNPSLRPTLSPEQHTAIAARHANETATVNYEVTVDTLPRGTPPPTLGSYVTPNTEVGILTYCGDPSKDPPFQPTNCW